MSPCRTGCCRVPGYPQTCYHKHQYGCHIDVRTTNTPQARLNIVALARSNRDPDNDTDGNI